MQIYVAAPFTASTRARQLAEQLEALGHEITYKWWAAENDPSWTPGEETAPDPLHEDIAHQDLRGTIRAQTLVALVPRTGGTGMWIEVGAALATAVPVYLVPLEQEATLPPWRSIFDLLCRRVSEPELFTVLSQMNRKRLRMSR